MIAGMEVFIVDSRVYDCKQRFDLTFDIFCLVTLLQSRFDHQ